MHGGVQVTHNVLRRKYWIVGGGRLVKGVINKCVPCVRSHPRAAHQLRGNLPLPRVVFTKAFLNTGVDFAGPIRVRTSA